MSTNEQCAGNGIIEFPEFVDLMSRRPWGDQGELVTFRINSGHDNLIGSEEELREAFAAFDHMKNGQVCQGELRNLLTTSGEKLTDEVPLHSHIQFIYSTLHIVQNFSAKLVAFNRII